MLLKSLSEQFVAVYADFESLHASLVRGGYSSCDACYRAEEILCCLPKYLRKVLK